MILIVIYFMFRRTISLLSMESIPDGFKAMVAAILIGYGMDYQDYDDSLGAADYVAGW
ncbi:MAG: hypothetical protein ACLSFO_00265 [Anaerovoracaceae bacterium]